jgi:hypothetical protein
MRYGKRKWSATGTEMPSNISRMMERIGGSGGGAGKGLGKSSKAKANQQGMKTDSQYQSQQKQLEEIKSKYSGGSTGGRAGIVKKSSSLKGQKRKKIKKEADTMEQNAQKQDALRKKAEKQEAQNKKDMEGLYGGWITPKGYNSKKAIKARREGKYQPGKIRKKKKKEEEKSTPFHHEGGSGK